MEYYFGVKMKLVDIEDVPRYISTPEYIEMEVFPKQNSMKVVDGILYIRTENKGEFN
jgi:predicted SPOUT superfamily RNA methylase MTH1